MVGIKKISHRTRCSKIYGNLDDQQNDQEHKENIS